MKSIDKLREYTLCKKSDLATRYEPSDRIADEIEAEIAERYMLLPVDADGVPIHVGDELFNKNKPTDVYKVTAIADNGYIRIYHDTAHIHSSQCRHVKPRTLEDVLVEYAETIDVTSWKKAHDNRSLTVGEWEEIVRSEAEKYADEIRELLGADAE